MGQAGRAMGGVGVRWDVRWASGGRWAKADQRETAAREWRSTSACCLLHLVFTSFLALSDQPSSTFRLPPSSSDHPLPNQPQPTSHPTPTLPLSDLPPPSLGRGSL